MRSELGAAGSPASLREWIELPPEWLKVRQAPLEHDPATADLHRGERETIALARRLCADLVVLDERVARDRAQVLGLRVTGLIGILDRAARRGVIDVRAAVARLRSTSFHASPILFKRLLEIDDSSSLS